MAVNLELYRIFYSVARAKSISQAARELFISQPAVTQAIKQLEKELGGLLFTRSARGVTLTREGELMLDYVERALDLIKGGEGRFQEMLNLERGHISIGASDSICKHFLLKHLEVFHERYPHLEIHVTNRTSRETIQLLKDGAVDIGFVNLPIDDEPQLVITTCLALHDCFVAGPKYFEAAAEIHDLKTLSEQPILLLERESNTRMKLDEFINGLGIDLKPAIELGSLDLLVEFAKIGLGFACVIEEFITAELSTGQLRKVELEERLPERAIGLIRMRNIPVSHAAQAFMNIVLEQSQ